ncbi:LPS export ABC transporter periplasmic protein LptC [Halomonas sp. GD1P12]|uniref:LPS export ABC transporter periplasmic protein LptC n=1 Tax=Halomonas sp. GD1P12 TaxID=2982691 RepID=UPI0021E4026E|nr:LPS export ABC transporter periplasmic protein LptC [Halomonas sp. GD1P12]UYF98555.1 LPS export ABC transporter periplasmic protein LptC [Halomonas sp. GD1P12]
MPGSTARRIKKRLWLPALVIALGAWLVWLDPGGPATVAVDPDVQREEPGHVLENAGLTLFNDTGGVSQRLDTPRLVHTPQRALTEIEAPRATLYDSEQRQWLASADHGTLQNERQTLILEGNARLLAPDEGWQLDTERLHYEGLERHAYTEAPALLQQPPQRMSAERMDVWLDESQVRMSDNVRGTHPPVQARQAADPTPQDPTVSDSTLQE